MPSSFLQLFTRIEFQLQMKTAQMITCTHGQINEQHLQLASQALSMMICLSIMIVACGTTSKPTDFRYQGNHILGRQMRGGIDAWMAGSSNTMSIQHANLGMPRTFSTCPTSKLLNFVMTGTHQRGGKLHIRVRAKNLYIQSRTFMCNNFYLSYAMPAS